MRRLWLLVPVVALLSCTNQPSTAPIAVSCQPGGSAPARAPFSFAPGTATAASAEQTAIALFRSCQFPETISDLTSSSNASTGTQGGPNEEQAVWLVHVDATITEPPPGASYQSHFLVEVNEATGVPTIVGQG